MKNNVTFTKADRSEPRRRDLAAGTVFVYMNTAALELRVVPDPAFSRHPNIAEKDFVVGGANSGSLDDANMDGTVALASLQVTY